MPFLCYRSPLNENFAKEWFSETVMYIMPILLAMEVLNKVYQFNFLRVSLNHLADSILVPFGSFT